mgnify:CR=1 FL=1
MDVLRDAAGVYARELDILAPVPEAVLFHDLVDVFQFNFIKPCTYRNGIFLYTKHLICIQVFMRSKVFKHANTMVFKTVGTVLKVLSGESAQEDCLSRF